MQRPADKQRDKSVPASVKSFDNSVPYGEISTEKYFGGKWKDSGGRDLSPWHVFAIRAKLHGG